MLFFIVLLPHCSVILSCLVSRRVKKRTGSSRSVWMTLSKSYSRPSRGPRRCPRSRRSSPRGWRHLTRCACLFVRVSVTWFNQCQKGKTVMSSLSALTLNISLLSYSIVRIKLFYSRLGGGTPRQLRGATEAAGGTTGGEESGVTEGDSSFRIFLTL